MLYEVITPRGLEARAHEVGPGAAAEDVLINITPQETRVAMLVSGSVQEVLVERTGSRGLVGNIYMGRVTRVLPGMQSAFVEVGLGRAAFLRITSYNVCYTKLLRTHLVRARLEPPRLSADIACHGTSRAFR